MPKKLPKYVPPVFVADGQERAAEEERLFYSGATTVTERASLTTMTTPVGPQVGYRKWAVEARRSAQQEAARAFLVDGGVQPDEPPAYGKEWDREYNPLPYPEAEPRQPDMREHDMYLGTPIGFLYQRGYSVTLPDGTEGWETGRWNAPDLVGWTLTRKGAEVRTRRRK